MAIKRFARKLPPIAWRDAKLRETRELNRRLRDDIARLKAVRVRGTVPPEETTPEDLVRRSGIFDEAWYRSQLDEPLPDGVDPVAHYLDHGAASGLSPHPAFLPSWYVVKVRSGKKSSTGMEAIVASPLLHYLSTGKNRGLSPHPMFDAHWFAEAYPESRQHAGGALGYFLAHGDDDAEVQVAQPLGNGPLVRSRGEFLRIARQAAEIIRDSRGHGHLQRDAPTFDLAAEAALKESLRAQSPLPDPAPVVSIVIPTKDRVAILASSVESVLAQTYAAWQLLIVDDGSRDGTAEMLAPYLADPRIELLTHPESRGVAAARNTGLDAATGEYIAYLDSDNTWRPDYVELMVRFMLQEGHRAAYAMSALVEEGGEERVLYRGMPFSGAALKERNFIDCIVLMHERALLDVVGTFDESLRRNVDWDLFIRLAEETDFGFLPVIATEYDVWETRTQRITTDEAVSYRFLVGQRALIDWEVERGRGPERVEDLMSVVIVASRNGTATRDTVLRVLETARGDVEVVVVDSGLPQAESVKLQFGLDGVCGVRYHRAPQVLTFEVARNVGATLASGANLMFLPEAAWCEPDWDRPLLQALDSHAAVQPLTLTDGGAVWSAGLTFLPNGRAALVYRGFAGDAPEVRGVRTVDGASALCLAVRAEHFAAVEGFDPLYVRHFSGAELSVRVGDRTGLRAACVGTSIVSIRTAPPDPTTASSLRVARENDLRLLRLWGERPSHLPTDLARDGYAMSGFERLRNTEVVPTPVLVHDRPDRPLRWAIKIGAPGVEVRTNWGDWHFALALRDSLERCGHEVTIDCYHEWYRPSAYLDDVVVVLRGVSRYEVNPGHTNVCWVISHPERVSAAEMEEYDLVFGASPRWCERVSAKLRQPVEVLLQCTDQRRFSPVEPDRRRAHPVLAVANARGIRPSVAAALQAGIVPAVYGVRWEGLLPEGAWQGTYLPNDELAAVYGAAGVVLNDHWEDMREEGLVSNRLFDLTACNAKVISDHMPEIREVFGDVVLTFRSAEDIPDLVATHLRETPERRAAREQMGEHVRAVHTFDARAATLSDRVVQTRSREAAAATMRTEG